MQVGQKFPGDDGGLSQRRMDLPPLPGCLLCAGVRTGFCAGFRVGFRRQFKVPAGVGSARAAPEGDPAGGQDEVVRVEIDRLQVGVGRLPHPFHAGYRLQCRERGVGVDVVLLLGFKALGSHGRTASFRVGGPRSAPCVGVPESIRPAGGPREICHKTLDIKRLTSNVKE